MAFKIGQLQFIDSLQFTMKSLDSLVSTLHDDDFIHTGTEFQDEQLKLMKKKGIFPYDYFNSIDRLDEPQLPNRRHFYNKLTDKRCKLRDYFRARLVWQTFQCKTFGDYHDLYLKGDVLLLADFFEKFRTTCLESYGLDAVHYYSGEIHSLFHILLFSSNFPIISFRRVSINSFCLFFFIIF